MTTEQTKIIEQLMHIIKECDASSTQTARIARIKCHAEAALNGQGVTFASVKDKRENHLAYIKQQAQKIAEQAVVIEKRTSALIASDDLLRSLENSGNFYGLCVMEQNQEALATPTDSKQILQKWLDKEMGEPVGYQELFNAIAAGTKPYAGSGISISVKAFTDYIGPLFKKPEIK